jgi:hypothetical protein
MSTLKSVAQISIPENDINCFNYIFNHQGLLVSTLQDKLFVLDVQNWDPLSVLFTEINGDFLPHNQMSKYIDSKTISTHKSLVALSFSDGTICILEISKNNTKVDHVVLDKFNIFEYHITKSDDIHTAELFKNLTTFRVTFYLLYRLIISAKSSFRRNTMTTFIPSMSAFSTFILGTIPAVKCLEGYL